MVSFKEMNLCPQLQKALDSLKFIQPTPIQEQAIPLAMDGKDIIGRAQTGTGKTAAFCIPIIEKLINKPQGNALILLPTRELAMQIADVLRKLTVHSPMIRSALLIGGSDMKSQLRALAGKPRIIVATPGRLNDHLRRGSVKLKNVEFLVLDESDRMLDMGFMPQLDEILKFLPATTKANSAFLQRR